MLHSRFGRRVNKFDYSNKKFTCQNHGYDFVSSIASYYFPFNRRKAMTEALVKAKVSKSSRYYGMDEKNIECEWQQSTTKGRFIHHEIEKFIKYNERSNSTEFLLFEKFIDDFKLTFTAGNCEISVCDETNRIQGTIDALLTTIDNRTILVEWKCCEKLYKWSKVKALSPFGDFPNTKFWKFCLQVNLYKYIYENCSENRRRIDQCLIVVLNSQKQEYKVYDVVDMQKQVHHLLNRNVIN